MTSVEIIAQLAQDRVVENLVANITHSDRVEMGDLAQMVYLILLEKPQAEIVRIYETDAMLPYIAVIIRKQWMLPNTPFYQLFRKFQKKTKENEDIKENDTW